MQVNSIGNVNATSFGHKSHKKEKECPNCSQDNGMVSVPRPLYNKLLGMAMLAMVAGGPVAMTSCDPMHEEDLPTDIFNDQKDKPISPDTYVVPTVTAKETTVSDNLSLMLESLGISAVKVVSDIYPSDAIKEGDVIDYSYHDNYKNGDYKLKINEGLSTKDTLVFDGTGKDVVSGTINYVRHTIASTADGIVVKEQATKRWKPPSENSGWITVSTKKYISAPDGVKEYETLSNGVIVYNGKYVPKTETSVSLIHGDGSNDDLTNISVSTLHNVNTGLHDVHM